ncbi:MAG TPA: NAD(P)H-binding protein, partial [Acidobacteriaceae bacterium]|nr:NAD(P)H-binding protein [Acidobacteriaceae bacterium]
MKIIVFGATGSTGREIVRQGVEEGHSVTAFTRSADAPLEENSEVRVVRGDVFDGAVVADAISGHRAVLSAL